MGDLHVQKIHKSIVIYTSTSVPRMVELVTDSFVKYARPRIRPTRYLVDGRPLGGWRIRFHLDLSFEFLLEKYTEKIPSWVLSSDEIFFAFLAGIFDAEGHVGIYAGKRGRGISTQFSVANSNRKLIDCLFTELRKRGCPVRIRTLKSVDSTWCLLVLERRALVQFLLKALPFRHPKKKEVARMILRLPPVLDAEGRRNAIGGYKMLVKSMKQDDRREGEESLATLGFRSNDEYARQRLKEHS